MKRKNRFIIGGLSPHIQTLPPEFLESGVVIGLNRWFLKRDCDFMLAVDTEEMWLRHPVELQHLRACKVLKQPESEGIPNHLAHIWYEGVNSLENIPTGWNGTLNYLSTSATAAMNLALIFSAKEIWLYGVDMVPGNPVVGPGYPNSNNHWAPHIANVNSFLNEIQKHCPVYKTNFASPLACEYREPL